MDRIGLIHSVFAMGRLGVNRRSAGIKARRRDQSQEEGSYPDRKKEPQEHHWQLCHLHPLVQMGEMFYFSFNQY